MTTKPPVNGVLDVILQNCKRYGDKPALHWLNKDGEVVQTLTYSEIEEQTLRTAEGLLDLLSNYDLRAGQKQCAVLCYPPGLEFILTFISCLRAGLIAVPVCSPSKHDSVYTTTTLNKITSDCCAVIGLTSKKFCEDPVIAEMMGTMALPWHCELIINDKINEEGLPLSSEGGEEKSKMDKCSLEDVIMLQYTSGSTGNPKGVINTNKSLLHNLELVKSITKTNDQTIELSFLPHYHDFGLFCSYLQPLYCGATGYFMSPLTFLQKPGQWIRSISKFKATHSQVPNFALELVMQKGYPQDVDLSSLQHISIGSEPIYPDAIHRFENELAPFGLRKNTVRAVYGLSEHTACVCGVTDGQDPLVIKGRISCGGSPPGVTVRIVYPDTRTEVGEGEEGEVWVNSPSKALGYWNKAKETQRMFEAELVNDAGKHYLRTGDLGFMSNGQLFISGRIKDVIVMYGRKIHPSDIEMSMESQFKFLRPGKTVACEYSDGKTGVAYIAELNTDSVTAELNTDSLTAELHSYSMQIATQISLQFQVNTTLVAFVQHDSMPSTTSGKKQRSLCKTKLLENSLPAVFRWAPSVENDAKSKVSSPTELSTTAKRTQVSPKANKLLPLNTTFSEKQEPKPTEWKGRQNVTPTDLFKQFNCELEEDSSDTLLSPLSTMLSKRRKSIVTKAARKNSRLPLKMPKVTVSELAIPKVSDPDTSSPQAKDRRGSRIIPAITATYTKEGPISVKLSPKQPARLEVSNLLCVRESSPRRRSAPPHAVNVEDKRIEEDARRRSMQDRKVMMVKKQRRNTLQILTTSISKVLEVELEPNSNIWAHGCNSLKAVQLSKNLQLDFGFGVEPRFLFQHQTPEALLENLQRRILNMPQSDEEEVRKREKVKKQEKKDWKTQSLDRNLASRRGSWFKLRNERRQMSLPKIICDDDDDDNDDDNDDDDDDDNDSMIASTTSSSSKYILESDEGNEEETEVAIVGMAGSFAGCDNTQQLWNMILNKQVATTSHADHTSHHTYNGGFSNVTGRFDHQFFGLSEREASTFDPRQSMLLHTVWECLQNSGYERPLSDIRRSECGVFVGISLDCDGSEDTSATSISSSIAAANRIARTFDLVGPTMTIDTSCASSLSALDAACLSLKAEDCTAALVCGGNAMLDKHRFKLLETTMGMLAPDEKCKLFDKTANGYVRGEGSGAVLLMPLSKARTESRRILAVIKSTATNNNGAAPTAFISGIQTKLINKALVKSKIDPSRIRYIEAGTKLGDASEGDAIRRVFRPKGDNRRVCLGSIKANIGHLESGAGIAGLIKTVLVLEHAQAPGNPCLQQMTPAFHLPKNISIPTDNVIEVFGATEKACAIVNCFGFGGTNATAVLQQYAVLPHMIRVEGGLLFLGAESSSHDLSEISKTISTLEDTFPKFRQASQACKALLKLDALTNHIAAFQLLYGTASLLMSLGTKFNIAGGIGIIGEILALSLAGAMKICQAMNFIRSYKSGNYPAINKIQNAISQPSISIFSCVLEKVFHPVHYETELKSEKYARAFLNMLKGESNRKSTFLTKALGMIARQTGDARPLLTLTINCASEQMSEIEQSLPDKNIVMSMAHKECPPKMSDPQYIRVKCMELRNLSDALQLKSCTKKPSRGPEHTLPRFYEKYPLRALVDKVGKYKSSTYSDNTTLINESGYVTQTASADSMTSPPQRAPPPSPSSLGIKMGMRTQGGLTDSCLKALWNQNPNFKETVEESSEDLMGNQKKEVLSTILKQVGKELDDTEIPIPLEELDDTEIPLEEGAESGIVGLDSINVMHLSDFLKKTYNIHFTVTELTQLKTLVAVAEAVVEQSSVLKKSISTPTN